MNVLDVSAVWARAAAAALLTLVAGRYLWVTGESAWNSEPATPRSATSAASSSSARIVEGGAPTPSGSVTVSQGKPMRVQLVITGGEDRSAVRVDGTSMGQSPLLTDFSCREGETVVIELKNAKGKIETFLRTCSPGTIRVEP